MRESRNDETVISQGLEVLQRNTETVTELISDLLDISKIAAGTSFEEVDFKEIVVQASKRCARRPPTKASP